MPSDNRPRLVVQLPPGQKTQGEKPTTVTFDGSSVDNLKAADLMLRQHALGRALLPERDEIASARPGGVPRRLMAVKLTAQLTAKQRAVVMAAARYYLAMNEGITISQLSRKLQKKRGTMRQQITALLKKGFADAPCFEKLKDKT